MPVGHQPWPELVPWLILLPPSVPRLVAPAGSTAHPAFLHLSSLLLGIYDDRLPAFQRSFSPLHSFRERVFRACPVPNESPVPDSQAPLDSGGG